MKTYKKFKLILNENLLSYVDPIVDAIFIDILKNSKFKNLDSKKLTHLRNFIAAIQAKEKQRLVFVESDSNFPRLIINLPDINALKKIDKTIDKFGYVRFGGSKLYSGSNYYIVVEI